MERVNVDTPVLQKNTDVAAENRQLFGRLGLLVVNLMSAPGAGKTTLLEETVRRLKGSLRIGVIEGDLATDLDAQRISAAGAPSYQIVTNTCCHLDAAMVRRALNHFDLASLDCLIVENIGNMVCPANFDLGEAVRVMVYSLPEGAEKPRKYPLMFHRSDVVLINKIDLLPYTPVRLEDLTANVHEVSPKAKVMPMSALHGHGVDSWIEWLSKAATGYHASRRAEVL